MRDDLIRCLISYYHFDAETAAEVLAELSDTKSLEALAGYRGGGAGHKATAHDFLG